MLHHPTLLSPFVHQTSRFSSQGMEVAALKKSKRPEAPALHNHGVGGGGGAGELNFNWIAEATSSFLGDEFSVDDLLDFEGLDDDEIVNEEEEVVDHHHHRPSAAEKSKLISSPDSGLTFQPSAPIADTGLAVYQADDDEADLEWVSRFVDDSYSAIPPSEMPTAAAEPPPPLKRVAGPMEPLIPVKAKRSKRPRLLGASWCTSSTSSSTTTTTTSSSPSSSSCVSSSFSSSPPCLVYDYYPSFANTELFSPESQKQKHKKKRGRKPKKQQQPTAEAAASGGGERRCSHCGVSKTPQWRAGPMGTKTLCNACGVRFKSGRLLPEYRPACSPTFSPTLHSNSHRKVLEMRHQKERQTQPSGATAAAAAAAAVPVAS